MARDQRAADRLRAVQPDVEGRVHRRAGLRVDRRARAVRLRQPVRPGHARRQDLRAAAGQQLLHLPGRGPGRDRQPRDAASPTRCSWPRRARWPSRSPKPISRRAASIRRCREHPRRLGAHRRRGRGRRLRAGARARRRARPTCWRTCASQMYDPQLPELRGAVSARSSFAAALFFASNRQNARALTRMRPPARSFDLRQARASQGHPTDAERTPGRTPPGQETAGERTKSRTKVMTSR